MRVAWSHRELALLHECLRKDICGRKLKEVFAHRGWEGVKTKAHLERKRLGIPSPPNTGRPCTVKDVPETPRVAHGEDGWRTMCEMASAQLLDAYLRYFAKTAGARREVA